MTHHSAARRPGAAAALALTLLSLCLAWGVSWGASPAAAHAALVASDPADGATLDRAPREVTLRFSEPIEGPAFVAVTAADDDALTAGDPAVDGADVTQRLEVGDATGTLTVAYRVVSADGHPIEGELTFDVRRTQPASPPSAEPEPGADAPAQDEAPADPVTEADTTPAAQQTEQTGGYWDQYGTVTLIGLGVAAAVVALLLAARRKGSSTG